jgi:hypothetical protein
MIIEWALSTHRSVVTARTRIRRPTFLILYNSTYTANRLATDAGGLRPPPIDGPRGPTTPPLAYPEREAPGVLPG